MVGVTAYLSMYEIYLCHLLGFLVVMQFGGLDCIVAQSLWVRRDSLLV